MLAKGFLFEPARHAWKLLTNHHYRAWCFLESRYRNRIRYTTHKIKLHNWIIEIVDSPSFLSAYREIFVKQIYDFCPSKNNPKILDLGANIGLSILYFKSKFPDSKVVAFEADPKIFSILESNIVKNSINNVELNKAAIWKEDTQLFFNCDGADGGGVSNSGDNLVHVLAVDIKEILRKEQFDFIKMDIEGAENEIYQELIGLVNAVPNIFIEYHSKPSEKQRLADILKMLTNEGYRVDIYSVEPCYRPFTKISNNDSIFDLQLNIFAKK
jgi:FkbM family methyltransferase